MKQKLAIILCSVLVATSGSMPVYAAGQSEAAAVGTVAAGQVQQEAYGDETLDAVGASLTAKTVTVTTKSAKAIQEALDQNQNGAYNLTVKLSAGTYNLDRALMIYSNTTIDATGSTLNKKFDEGAMLEAKVPSAREGYSGGYTGSHDITVKGGTWDSRSYMGQSKGVETLRFIHCKNIKIENATLCNVPESSHLIVLAGVQNATVTKCTFYGYGKYSADGNGYKNAKKPKEAVQLDTVHSVTEVPTSQPSAVKWDDKPCDNVTIENCTFSKFSRGIGSHTAVQGELHSNVNILNNTFENLSDSAIRLYNYKDSVVKGNKITNAVEGVLIYTFLAAGDDGDNAYFKPLSGKAKALPANYNITVSNNTIKKITDTKGTWGDGVRVIGRSSQKVTGVTISNNTISTVSRYGIFATQAPKIKISGNTITSPTSDGILLDDGCTSSVIATGNKISNGKSSGIAIYSSNSVTVYGNTISSPKANGIYLLDSDSCVIGKSAKEYNTIKSAGGEGISLSAGQKKKGCTSTKVQYNKITSAKKDGIFVYKSPKTTVKGNTVSSKLNAVNVNTNSKYAKITDNTLSASGTGVWLASGSKGSTVSGNTIKKFGTAKSDANGIYVYKAGGTSSKRNTVISENTITTTSKSGTKKNAIKVSESNYTTMSKNAISSVPGCGIYVYKSQKNTVDSNTINSTGKNGIYITTSCKSATVKGNTVKKAGDVSIMLYGAASSSVTKNKVTGSKKYRGIWISQSNKTTVKSNTVKGTKKKEAVFVSGSTGCKVKSNKTS